MEMKDRKGSRLQAVINYLHAHTFVRPSPFGGWRLVTMVPEVGCPLTNSAGGVEALSALDHIASATTPPSRVGEARPLPWAFIISGLPYIRGSLFRRPSTCQLLPLLWRAHAPRLHGVPARSDAILRRPQRRRLSRLDAIRHAQRCIALHPLHNSFRSSTRRFDALRRM